MSSQFRSLLAALILVAAPAAASPRYPSPILGGAPTTIVSGTVAANPFSDFVCAAPGAVVNLDVPQQMGEDHVIADCLAGAAANPITVNAAPGSTIAGQASYVLSINGQALHIRWTPYGWAPY